MNYVVTNAYYFRSLNAIGGIESHLYYLAKKYSKITNITVFYQTAENKQLNKLKEYARCIQLKHGDTVECENLFCCFNREILDFCKAKNKYLVLHGDYKDMLERGQLVKSNLPIDSRIDKYLGVSKHVCKTWEAVTGIKAEFIGEPVEVEKASKPLLFLSATRLGVEKGWQRMKKLAQAMNSAGIKYLWLIYTNSKKTDTVKNMVIMPPDLNISGKMGMFDAIIQLSDNEGFNLTCVEGLLQGIPFIGTDLPVYHELGLNESNSILIKSDMSDIPVLEIAKIKEKQFEYHQPVDHWRKYLKKERPTYKNRRIKVIATGEWVKRTLLDRELEIIPPEGHEWAISEERLAELTDYEQKTGSKLVIIGK